MVPARVLFLCSGNSARSQMAEAFLRHDAGDRFEVYSAGVEPKPIHPLTERVMAEVGLPLEGHYSKPLTLYMGKVHFTYLITVCAAANEHCPRTFPGMGHRLHWEFEDPAAFEGDEEDKLNRFRVVRDQIRDQIQRWVAELPAD